MTGVQTCALPICQIESSVKVMVESNKHTANAQIEALSAEVRELTQAVKNLEANRGTDLGAILTEAKPHAYGFEELQDWIQNQNRVSDAFEAALEAKNLALLERLCEIVHPRTVADHCSQVILLCIVQQLSIDLPTLSNSPSDEAVARLTIRANWLKQCSLKLRPSDPTTQPHLAKTLTKVRSSVEKVSCFVFS